LPAPLAADHSFGGQIASQAQPAKNINRNRRDRAEPARAGQSIQVYKLPLKMTNAGEKQPPRAAICRSKKRQNEERAIA